MYQGKPDFLTGDPIGTARFRWSYWMAVDDCYDFTLILSGGIIDWIQDEKLVCISEVFTWFVPFPPFDNDE
jgi:hypothetical protein